MPPQPIIPNWVRVIARLSHESNTMMIGFDFKPNAAGPYTNGQLGDLLTSMWSAFGTELRNAMTTTWTVAALEATDRTLAGGAFATYIPSVGAGTLSGDSLPANCAVVLSKRTGLSGRRNHGRAYIPGLSDTGATGSVVGPTYLLILNALVANMLAFTGASTLTGKLAIASISDLAMKTITAYAVDAVIDSQRRRLPGRGF